MTSKRIIWRMPDGTVRVTNPAWFLQEGETEEEWMHRTTIMLARDPEACPRHNSNLQQTETDHEFLDRIAAERLASDPVDMAGAVRMPNVDMAELPSRRFRNQWHHDGTRPAVDVAKARAQILAELRAERDKRLAASDADKARLDDVGTGPQKAALAKYRQALRDVPAAVAVDVAALDAAALESYTPAWPAKPERPQREE
jgi:hypothetical protein